MSINPGRVRQNKLPLYFHKYVSEVHLETYMFLCHNPPFYRKSNYESQTPFLQMFFEDTL